MASNKAIIEAFTGVFIEAFTGVPDFTLTTTIKIKIEEEVRKTPSLASTRDVPSQPTAMISTSLFLKSVYCLAIDFELQECSTILGRQQ